MTATGFRREIGPVNMGSQHLRPARGLAAEIADQFEKAQMLIVPSDRSRRRATRRPVPGMCRQHFAKRFRRPIHEVGPVAAMNVQIHKSR